MALWNVEYFYFSFHQKCSKLGTVIHLGPHTPFMLKKPSFPSVSVVLIILVQCLACIPAANTVYVQGATFANVNLTTCQTYCQINPSCTFYTWNNGTKVCQSNLTLYKDAYSIFVAIHPYMIKLKEWMKELSCCKMCINYPNFRDVD